MSVKRGYRTIQHDVRGVGKSIAAVKDVMGSEQFTFDQYAKDASGLMDHLNLSQCYVLGMAWGSRVAFVTTAHFPARCLGFACFDFSIGNSLVPEWSFAQKIGNMIIRSDAVKAYRHQGPALTGS
jgi:pimeloyl-ACP methyl ester carboxylesterase